MRPIKLKIRGLNSFIETQEIDFNKLMYRGLFGIFGPTGSGKSTILDGITLALYGDVARKSSNFINTNCSVLNVSFEFQISGKEIKLYMVEREYKRDKDGRARTKSSRILDITEGEGHVLEEGVKNVNKKCEEIIGLRLEDFTRTVVLPQGKFSEFLTLSGKERRDMLERLFNLQKYGNELSSKLSVEVSRQKQKFNVIEGQLKGYDNINEDIFKARKKALCMVNDQYDNYEIQLKKLEIVFNEGKELWNLQNELQQRLIEQKKLEQKKDYIEQNDKKIQLCESALKVKPYVDNYENTIKKIGMVKNELLDFENQMKDLENNKQKIYLLLNEARSENDNELPKLKLQYQNITDAVRERDMLYKITDENKLLEKSIVELKEDIRNLEYKIGKNSSYIESVYSNISCKEHKSDDLKISEEYREKVNQGMLILNDFENLVKQREGLYHKIKITENVIEITKNEIKTLSDNLNGKKHLQLEKTNVIDELLEHCPGDQNMLLEFQKKISCASDKWNQYNRCSMNIAGSRNLVVNFRKELRKYENDIEALVKKINMYNRKIESIHTENLANILRAELIEGEPCPVCGSIHHCRETIRETASDNLERLKLELNEKEKRYEILNGEIIKLKTNITAETRNIEKNQEELKELGDDFKSATIENMLSEFNRLKKSIENFNLQKQSFENEIKVLNEDKNKMEIMYNKKDAVQEQNRNQLLNLQQELEHLDGEYEKAYEKLTCVKSELNIDDFKKKSRDIYIKDNERISIEKELKKLRTELKESQDQREVLNKKFTNLREKLSEKKTSIIENNKIIGEKRINIKNKVGSLENIEELENIGTDMLKQIEHIEHKYIELEKQKDEIDHKYNRCNSNMIAVQKNLLDLNERSINDKTNLEQVLKRQEIHSVEDVKNNIIPVLEINRLKHEIEQYRDMYSKLAGTIENLKQKIGNRNLTEEKWVTIQNVKNDKSRIFEELKKTRINLEAEVKYIGEKLIELKELLKSKEKLTHKLSILADLDKLFKGKKFVEFVAANQLKYISIEASKILRHITCGNYGLEVDEEGKFLIIDYKNGGKKRDASTLSGGEIFVTSLALALALSAQIQLKGTAPLELFFLDEGFGTLDDNLLEIVMDALEKIHNDRLSIGIISHLESIKDRVPVKLLVTPAESGIGGSRVKIE